jgi:hypothetical protein
MSGMTFADRLEMNAVGHGWISAVSRYMCFSDNEQAIRSSKVAGVYDAQ